MSEFLYLKIKSYLLGLVKEHRNRPDYTLPSENALCKRFSTTRMTVRRAIRALIDEGFLVSQKGKGTFIVPDTEFIMRPTNEFVGLVMPALDSQHVRNIVRGARDVLQRNGLHLIIHVSDEDTVTRGAVVKKLLDAGVVGILYLPHDYELPHDELKAAAANNTAVVFIDRTVQDIELSSAVSDHREATRAAVRQLHAGGCREIGLVLPPPHASTVAALCFNGYRDAHTALSRPVNDDNLHFLTASGADVYEALLSFLSENPQIDGLICAGGRVGLQLYDVLSHLYISVPDQMQIILYDDEYKDFARFLPFTPTVIRQNSKRLGEEAARLILDAQKKSNSIIQTKLLIECALIKGNSTV